MPNLLAILAGACYSAAYIFPKPYCYLGLTISTICVILMRELK